MPSVQERLSAAAGRHPGKTLNADEAACAGALLLVARCLFRAACCVLLEPPAAVRVRVRVR